MENITESHNSNIGATSKQFILPSLPQLLLYALIATMVLFVLNARKAWDYLNNTILASQGGATSLIAHNSPAFQKVFDSLSKSIILQVVFWVLIGCLVYIVIWFVRNIAINLLNDFVADNYVHPKSYSRSNYWSSILARKFFFWISTVILFLFTVSGIRLLAYLSSEAYHNIVHFHINSSLPKLIVIELAATGFIYSLILLSHIALNSWRLISRDL
jgi:hypothetical protein